MIWPFRRRWTPDSERENGRAAARALLATNPSREVLSNNYSGAKMDELHPIHRGPYFAEGYIEVLRTHMRTS